VKRSPLVIARARAGLRLSLVLIIARDTSPIDGNPLALAGAPRSTRDELINRHGDLVFPRTPHENSIRRPSSGAMNRVSLGLIVYYRVSRIKTCSSRLVNPRFVSCYNVSLDPRNEANRDQWIERSNRPGSGPATKRA